MLDGYKIIDNEIYRGNFIENFKNIVRIAVYFLIGNIL
jgi:hypothetical protein